MNPPLRSTRDRDALRLALATGLIDFVATDHAPHELEVKGPNFKTAAFGTTGLETSLRVLLDLCRVGELSHNRLVDVFAMLPGAFLGLKIPKIDVGQRLRAVLLEDIDVGHEVSTKQLYSTSQNNVFLGTQLPGQVRDVYPGNAHRYTVQI
jgi:dihydroorotase